MIKTTRSPGLFRLIGLGAADVAALVYLFPDWDALGRGLMAPHRWASHRGADGAIGPLCGAALWLTALWLAIGLAAAALSIVPGRLGARGRRLARQLLPAAVQRALAVTAGLSLLASTVPAGAANPPGPSGRVATAVASAPAWPTTGPPLAHLAVNWPVTESTGPVRALGPVSADAGPRTLVVAPGDSLWRLAARHLGPDPAPARIAAAWPRWYAANRALIGPDPGLLEPGQVLVIPPATGP